MKKNKTRDDLYMEDVPQNTKATVRRLLSRLGRQNGRLLVVTAATLLSSAAYAAIPLLVGMALDNLLAVLRGGASAEQKLSLAAGALFLPVLLLLAASAASSLLAYVQQYVIACPCATSIPIRRGISSAGSPTISKRCPPSCRWG